MCWAPPQPTRALIEPLSVSLPLSPSTEKLEGEKLNVAEVTQSEIAQKQKLQTVLERINDSLKLSTRSIRWNVDCEDDFWSFYFICCWLKHCLLATERSQSLFLSGYILSREGRHLCITWSLQKTTQLESLLSRLKSEFGIVFFTILIKVNSHFKTVQLAQWRSISLVINCYWLPVYKANRPCPHHQYHYWFNLNQIERNI